MDSAVISRENGATADPPTGDLHVMSPPEVSAEAANPAAPLDADLELAERLFERATEMASAAQRPLATYRVQFNAGFTFANATALVPYWQAMGITHIYASPYLKSGRHSNHGYDVVDHGQIDPRIGTDDDLARFVAALREHGMGHILDIVPNHMGVGTDENAWWNDVLERGISSPYAQVFDIDWHPLKPDLENKVLLPVLGEQFGTALESQKLTLHFQDGVFFLIYGERRFPIAVRSYGRVLRDRLEELSQRTSPDSPEYTDFQSILTAIHHLPPFDETDAEKRQEGLREQEVIKRRLKQLCETSAAVREFIAENVDLYNGQSGDESSFDRLDMLLREQAYRLSYWQVAADEINYRRFFDVNELAAVSMELPVVFQRTHERVLQLVEEGSLQGLRIDHADGLFDPAGYLWQLQRARWLQLARSAYRERELAGEALQPWDEVARSLDLLLEARRQSLVRKPPLYTVVEKILESGEQMPDDWSIDGTTGYEFLNHVNGILVHPQGHKLLDSTYARFAGEKVRFEQLTYATKRLIMKVSLAGELNMLGHRLDRLSECKRQARDFTLAGLTHALREVMACFPVYRTYVSPNQLHERDRRYIHWAVALAKRQNPATSRAVFDFVEDVLLTRAFPNAEPAMAEQMWQFLGRLQQFTGALMAKAVEDTAYYRYHRLVSLNEVGGDPRTFSIALDAFHRFNGERRNKRPFTLSATATHDTKRGEDVRARIDVLSEWPRRWKEHVSRWTRWNRAQKTRINGEGAPSKNDEYLLYQTLLGTFPFRMPEGPALEVYIQRITEYMLKAMREAKVNTSWIAQNVAYEEALARFVATLLKSPATRRFREDFYSFAVDVARAGIWNSLTQTVLKIFSPGVPDLYQGTELWDLNLVDPDNRRAVDFASRRELLDRLRQRLVTGNGDTLLGQSSPALAALARELVETASDGRIKCFVLMQGLNLRRAFPTLFTTGEYLPLEATGAQANHVCAFARVSERRAALVVAPRFAATLDPSARAPVGAEAWTDTRLELPPALRGRVYEHVFTGARLECDHGIPLATIFETFPVAALVTETEIDVVA